MMIMYNLIKTVTFVLIAAIGVTAQQQLRPSLLSSATVFPGGFLSYSVRDGYRKYEGMRELEHIERGNLVMYGVSGGKRFAFKNPRLRIQSTLEFGWGAAIDDVYENIPVTIRHIDNTLKDTTLNISMHDNLFTVGVQNELHILLSSTGIRSYFLSLGPGVSWSSFERTGKTDFGQKMSGVHDIINNVCFNFNIGAGIDYKSNENHTLSIGYNFRIWHPVNYKDLTLFPMGVDYKELFFTHMLQVQILILPQSGKVRY